MMKQSTKPRKARYSKEAEGSGSTTVGGDSEIVIEIDGSESGHGISGGNHEEIKRGPEQAILSGGGGGDSEQADKRAGTFERHINGYAQHAHAWGSTFNPSEADDNFRFAELKRTQNVGEYDRSEDGGLHTSQDARIFRRFRSISKGLELPRTIQQRAGRILGEIREMPREVCHAWGSELTIAACIITAVDDFDYTLQFEKVYAHLPKHPDRDEESARHRFDMALKEVQSRHRLRDSNVDDAVVATIRFIGETLSLNRLTIATAEGMYEALGFGPTERDEAHSYGKTEPTLAAGYVHAVAMLFRDADQETVSSTTIAESLNITSSAVSAPSKAIRETVTGTNLSLPAFAGVEPFVHSNSVATADLIAELKRLADELGKPPSQKDMNEHGQYSYLTYQNRFGSWKDAIKGAGMNPREKHIETAELKAELRRLADELEKSPSQKDMNEHGQYSHPTYQNRFGSWSDAKAEVGV